MESTRRTLMLRGGMLILLLVFTQFAQAQTETTWTQLFPLFPPDGPPAGRLLHSAAYHPTANRMTVFGGRTSGGLVNDVWVLINANGQDAGTPTWTQLQPDPTGGAPSARVAHTATYDIANNRLTVFGGQTSAGAAVNDVWVLTNANGQDASAPTWTQLQPDLTSGAPTVRFGHSAIYDPASNRMTAFGGLTASGLANDVWVLTNANGQDASTPTWTQLQSDPTGAFPSSRSLSSAVYDAGTNRMTVFGGLTDSGPVNDVWVLTNANGQDASAPTWTQLQPDPTGGAPTARFVQSAIYDSATNRLVVFGGQTGSVLFNDVWVLTNANGLGGSPVWIQLSPTGGPPNARFGHSAIYDPAGNRMTVFGGGLNLTGSSFVNDVWVLTKATGIVESIVAIDVRPNSITAHSQGLIRVDILSSATFDAPTVVDTASLTFGRIGDEASLAFCNASATDVNSDGLLDLVCHFLTQETGFQPGDTIGTLKGKTLGGAPFRGTDSTLIVR